MDEPVRRVPCGRTAWVDSGSTAPGSWRDPDRKSGIPVVGAVPWGTHFCQFYETRQDLVDVLVPYFAAGLEAGEFCMCIASPPFERADVEAELRRRS